MDTVTLQDVDVGTRLEVLPFQETSPYTAQLQRLGLVPGTEVYVVRRAPLGDPIEIRLRGFSLALRPSESHALKLRVIE
ncbi:MAG: ferrous iron transport protein A [Limisphaerales bacterium]|jgi:ferrous iron transport protein A